MATEIPGQILPLVDENKLADPIWYEWFGYLRGAVRALLAFQANAEAAWTPFAPTITATGGGPPTTTKTARYRKIGQTVQVHYDITVTTIAGSTGNLIATLPVAPAAIVPTAMYGTETAITGVMAKGVIAVGLPSVVQIAQYNNTSVFALAVNSRFVVDGTYEV